MELKLNVYAKNDGGKYEIEKTYATETIDIMFGTAEDLISTLEALTDGDTSQMVAAIAKGFKQLKPFLKDIFEGLTDDELRRTKVKELIPLFVNIFTYLFNEMDFGNSSKN